MNPEIRKMIEKAGLHPGKDAAIKLEAFAKLIAADCVAECKIEADIREKAGLTWPENSEERARCYAGSRAATNCMKAIRSKYSVVTPG